MTGAVSSIYSGFSKDIPLRRLIASGDAVAMLLEKLIHCDIHAHGLQQVGGGGDSTSSIGLNVVSHNLCCFCSITEENAIIYGAGLNSTANCEIRKFNEVLRGVRKHLTMQ
jgi:hypothetical protein